MVRDLQHIEKDLESLENQVNSIALQLETVGQEYMEILGDTLQKQLIFSVYQICTQEYPQAFLNLSLSQQQQLQKKIRDLGKEAKDNLNLGGEILNQVQFNEEESENILSEAWESNNNSEPSLNTEINTEALKKILQEQEKETHSITEEGNPEKVIAWSSLREEATVMILENVSSQANEILQDMNVLPQDLPKEMIDAAIQSEGAGSMSNRAPGVLHLMLEMERNKRKERDESEEEEVMQLTILRLRVAELEFAAPSLNTKRRELRTLEQKLQQFNQQYLKLKKERSIAQAELAWRSSWHED